MNSQQEYVKFMANLSDKVRELQNEFDGLSEETKQRVAQEINAFLKVKGYAITIEDLMRNS